MKNGSTNTFSEGMIKDLHPLTTPANVLTNCLNGTILTYNGNEYVLQNDMGNGKVGTAELPAGYVPVGMVEQGGIIYVAAHNPLTHMSQIGSFPSPQQLYTDDVSDLVSANLKLSEMITSDSLGRPRIDIDYLKIPLMMTRVTSGESEAKTLYPGDKFVLKIDNNNGLFEAMRKGFVTLRLGVVNSSGFVDYIDNDALRIYNSTYGNFICESTKGASDLLADNSMVQVFNSKSSGQLVLVVQLNTFNTYDLIRKYAANEDCSEIKISLTGKMTSDLTSYNGDTQVNTSNIGLVANSSNDSAAQPKIEYTLTNSNKIVNDIIYPACTYGYIPRLGKQVTFNFDNIRKNKEDFSEFRYFVDDNYIKIGWGYDYYNLSDDTDIQEILFAFYHIGQDPSKSVTGSVSDAVYHINIQKDYYNGNFEDTIPFGSLLPNQVYVVRIDKKVNGTYSTITHELVYTGKYFNQFYGSTMRYSDLKNNRLTLDIPVTRSYNTEITDTKTSLQYKYGYTDDSTNWQTPTALLPSAVTMYDGDENPNYKYAVRKVNEYTISIQPTVSLTEQDTKFAGTFPSNTLSGYYQNTGYTITDSTAQVEYNENSDVATTLKTSLGNPLNTVTNASMSNGVFTGKFTTSKGIIGYSGEPSVKSIAVERLEPVYIPSMAESEYNKLFSFRDDKGLSNTIAGAIAGRDDDNKMYFNTTIHLGSTDTDLGTNVGNNDDKGLQTCMTSLGGATIGIFCGIDNMDDSSYRITKHSSGGYRVTIHGDWSGSQNEIDVKGDWMTAVWKDETGQWKVVNLASRKSESNRHNRLNWVLRSLLSQMLVVQKRTSVGKSVGPSPTGYIYQTKGATTKNITFKVATGSKTVDRQVEFEGVSYNINASVDKWSSKGVENYLPIFTLTYGEDYQIPFEFGEDIDIATSPEILSIFTSGASISNSNEASSKYDKTKIYIADPNTADLSKSNGYTGYIAFTPDADGNYVPSTSFQSLTMFTTNSSGDVVKGSSYSLPRDINRIFIPRTALGADLETDEYNEVYLRSSCSTYGSAYWTHGTDSPAPDMVKDFYWQPHSPFRNA